MTQLQPSETCCRSASLRTAQWAAQAVGRTRQAGAHFNALAWYKGLTCFSAVSDSAAAADLLQRFAHSGETPGDFHPRQDITLAQALATLGSGLTWSNVFAAQLHAPLGLWRNYRNAWIAYGAQRAGAAPLAQAALDRLVACINAELDAVPHDDRLDPAQRRYDIGTNASVVHALLAAGRIDAAIRLGQFMKRVVMAQAPAAPRIHQALDASGQPVNAAGSKLIRMQYWIEVGAPGQMYWVLGFALKAFAMLFTATGSSEWLDPAQRIQAWLGRCHEDYSSGITCAKLAWGSAEMFAASGDKVWRDIAATSIGAVAAGQNEQGVWIRPDYPRWFPQPLLISIDTSIERMFYLLEVPRSLRQGGLPLAA